MIWKYIAMLAVLAAVSIPGTGVLAGPFDCSVAYDEYDSFMNRNFLIKPEAYVATLENAVTQAQASKQAGALMLRSGRQGMGAAVIRTNKNAYGKFLFSWEGRGDLRGTPLLILRDVTVFAKVETGAGQKKFREIRISASQLIDLDSGRATQGGEADIRYQAIEAKTIRLEAINGARLVFPMETLCK
jgi:hypothetical protein